MYPQNAAAFYLFADLATQWRVGMAGATGLDYAVLPALMDMHGIAPEHRRERFAEIRVMERSALETMASKRKK